MTTKTTTRRSVLTAAAALAAVPAMAGTTSSVTPETAIGRLWADAERLRDHLGTYRTLIAEKEDAGIPGWMRLAGAPNQIGQQRYEKLVSILSETPRNGRDLAIMARAARQDDVLAKGWAHERVAVAAEALGGALVG